MQELLKHYLQQTLPKQDDWITELEHQAVEGHVPIMDPVSMQFVLQMIRIKRPKRILEIGTAIGYSTLRMAEACPDALIVTIERDEQRYQQAMLNIRNMQKEDQIKVQCGDALDKINELDTEVFDFIFIDAAKGQYKKFFDLTTPLLAKSGVILSDNVLFRGYVAHPETTPKKYKKMVEKLIAYNEYLSTHPDFNSTIVPIGDGVAVSYKR